MAPEDIIQKTFSDSTQYAMTLEAENCMSGRRHYKSRFGFLKENRTNDDFASGTFFPTIKLNTGDTCSQLFMGNNTDCMKVFPMKQESHSFKALQDFARNVGIPRLIKTDNATTEVVVKWTSLCRDNIIDTQFTEPHSPWQNIAEQGIGDLGRMVSRCIRAFMAPLNRHQCCQKW